MKKSIETQKLINEKVVQRYIFEKLNYGNKETLKEFYPETIYKGVKDKTIKVIIPEYPIECTKEVNGKVEKFQHVTDFRIIYKDNTYHNVEVEWRTSRFNSHTREVYEQCYKGGKGFIIVFYDDSSYDSKISYIDNKNIKEISTEEFTYWFAFKSKHLVEETLINYIPKYTPRNRNIWLIYLPTYGANKGNSENDFLKRAEKKGKWAFRYSEKGVIMKNILDIYRGDLVVFIWGLKIDRETTHQRKINIENDWYVSGVVITEVIKGYYCDDKDDTFEKENWKIHRNPEDKEYMHYFNFDKKYRYSSVNQTTKLFLKDTKLMINERNDNLKGIIENIRLSLNKQGAPEKITVDDYNALLMHLGIVSSN
ncbi:hypothetical protein [Sutcliffiella cohnii]|uniref:hypothetical protein n=1 Tax=Sutcliffiella cohnii TaxID=33932 RepID=UPI002E1E2874|nr:hypothetical protein [Sutcliffiella cohnii]